MHVHIKQVTDKQQILLDNPTCFIVYAGVPYDKGACFIVYVGVVRVYDMAPKYGPSALLWL